MNSVVHFEMPYKDAKRVAKFYKSAFAWGMEDTGPNMGNYIVAVTTPVDKKTTRPKEPGAINGGFYAWKKESKEPSVVISVADFKKSMAMIKKAGGRILDKSQDIPGIGMWVSFLDSEGNRVSILQPKDMFP